MKQYKKSIYQPRLAELQKCTSTSQCSSDIYKYACQLRAENCVSNAYFISALISSFDGIIMWRGRGDRSEGVYTAYCHYDLTGPITLLYAQLIHLRFKLLINIIATFHLDIMVILFSLSFGFELWKRFDWNITTLLNEIVTDYMASAPLLLLAKGLQTHPS